MVKSYRHLCCVSKTKDKISSPKLLSYKVKHEDFFPLNWTPQQLQSNPSPLMFTKHQIISSTDKETQTEAIEAISSNDGSNYTPSVLPSREDAPLQPITCSLCKHKYHYHYQTFQI